MCHHVIHWVTNCLHQRKVYRELPVEDQSTAEGQSTDKGQSTVEQQSPKGRQKCTCIVYCLEWLGFLMQLGALVSIPILLSEENFFSLSGKTKHYIVATYVLIPVSLFIISFIWSGLTQTVITKPSSDNNNTARLKTGTVRYS